MDCMKHTTFVTSAYFRLTSASGSDAGSTRKNGGSNRGEHPILAEVSFSASLKSLLFNEKVAEVGGSKAEVNPRTPYTLLPPTRISNVYWVVRYNAYSRDWRQRHAC